MKYTRKYYFLMCYLLVPLVFLVLILDIKLFLLFFLGFTICIQLADYFLYDTSNYSQHQEQQLLNDKFYTYTTYLGVPIQLFTITFALYLVHTLDLSWYQWIIFTYGIGIFSGMIGINLAHEMQHKNNKIDQLLCKILLITTCYGHFFIYHIKGHHVLVATPEDPVTARLGQSLHQFFRSSVKGTIKAAWQLERTRLLIKGYPLYSFHNNFWWIIAAPLIISILCFIYGGFNAVAFFLVQSYFAVASLEAINYIQHYGLERKKLANGAYESVTHMHSWNSNRLISNILLFKLPRHVDHHLNGARPFQCLRSIAESPELPAGYLGMLAIAQIPPLWRFIMDKRVISYRNKTKKVERVLECID